MQGGETQRLQGVGRFYNTTVEEMKWENRCIVGSTKRSDFFGERAGERDGNSNVEFYSVVLLAKKFATKEYVENVPVPENLSYVAVFALQACDVQHQRTKLFRNFK